MKRAVEFSDNVGLIIINVMKEKLSAGIMNVHIALDVIVYASAKVDNNTTCK